MNIVSNPTRNAAKGQPCVRCLRNDGTVVAAHYQGFRSHRLGKGQRIKPHDLFVADLCAKCHAFFDGYGNRKRLLSWVDKLELSEEFLFYVALTQLRRVQQGIITIKGYEP